MASSASAICLWDPIQRCHVVVANHGYPETVNDHSTPGSSTTTRSSTRCANVAGGTAVCDFPNYRTTYTRRFPEVFVPAGFDEGPSARLVTADGIYTGTIHVNCDDPRHPPAMTTSTRSTCCGCMAERPDFTMRPRMVAELMSPEAQSGPWMGLARRICCGSETCSTRRWTTISSPTWHCPVPARSKQRGGMTGPAGCMSGISRPPLLKFQTA